MRLELARQSGSCTGAILLDGQTLPVQAQALNGALQGTFTSQGKAFPSRPGAMAPGSY